VKLTTHGGTEVQRKSSLLTSVPLCVVVFVTPVITAACGGATTAGPPAIRLVTADEGRSGAFVEVTGLPDRIIDALEDADYSPEAWSAILRVAVGPNADPVLGTHRIVDGTLRFLPEFPFDPGRQYHVSFDPARIEGADQSTLAPLVATVSLPATQAAPSTVVSRVYPSGEVVPENLLRMYVEFSAPMGRRSGIEHMKLLNGAGEEIAGAILPLDYEFWSPDHRRFTVFFDPGRVKDGILPNRQMGRPLERSASMTFVVSREWRDEHGLPLKDDYRRTFRVAAADTTPIDPAAWRIQAPPAPGLPERLGAVPRRRDPLVVTFPEPLDRGLLMRALGVRRDGAAVEGDIVLDANETRWTFTPRDPWRAGRYELLALDILEDLAGNQIGRAFEVDNFETVDKSPDPQSIRLAFTVPE
jgi:hypothetical protein